MNTMRVGAEDGKSLVAVDLAGLVGGVYGATQLARLSRRTWDWVAASSLTLSGGLQMTRIDGEWLEAFDEAMLGFFAIDHADAGMDQYLLACYSDLPAREAALAFGEDYELSRVNVFWPPPRLALSS